MAREENTGKSQQEHRDRVWELAEQIRYCMFVTWDGKKQAARAMDARTSKDQRVIYFLTDRAGKKVAQIRKFPTVTVTFANPSGFKFVSMSGDASISNDRAKIKELWEAADKAWWDSAEDPDIRLVTFSPAQAELWDSPNILVSTVLMLSAAVTGSKPKVGDHAKVAMPIAARPQRPAKSKAAGGTKPAAKTPAKPKAAAGTARGSRPTSASKTGPTAKKPGTKKPG